MLPTCGIYVFRVTVTEGAVNVSSDIDWFIFMFCVPCIAIQLCDVNQQMNTFQINGLIQFSASSKCFEHNVFIIRRTVCICSFVCYVFHAFM